MEIETTEFLSTSLYLFILVFITLTGVHLVRYSSVYEKTVKMFNFYLLIYLLKFRQIFLKLNVNNRLNYEKNRMC